MVCQKNAWPKDCQHTHTRQLMCVRGMNNRKHRASAVKAVHGLLQSDFLQVKETNRARDEKGVHQLQDHGILSAVIGERQQQGAGQEEC